jgi:hypothetical protein
VVGFVSLSIAMNSAKHPAHTTRKTTIEARRCIDAWGSTSLDRFSDRAPCCWRPYLHMTRLYRRRRRREIISRTP